MYNKYIYIYSELILNILYEFFYKFNEGNK